MAGQPQPSPGSDHALEQQIKTITEAASKNADAADAQAPPRAVRHRLPAERASVTHKFGLSGHEGYITVGLYPNGQPGEIFIRMAKEGSTVSGLMDSFATAVSLALQHGVPLRVLCEKFAHTRFEPSGSVQGNDTIKFATSILDYVFRELAVSYLERFDLAHVDPSEGGFDALGKGEDEGKAPAAKFVSRGLTRNRTDKLSVVSGASGGGSTDAVAAGGNVTALAAGAIGEPAQIRVRTPQKDDRLHAAVISEWISRAKQIQSCTHDSVPLAGRHLIYLRPSGFAVA